MAVSLGKDFRGMLDKMDDLLHVGVAKKREMDNEKREVMFKKSREGWKLK